MKAFFKCRKTFAAAKLFWILLTIAMLFGFGQCLFVYSSWFPIFPWYEACGMQLLFIFFWGVYMLGLGLLQLIVRKPLQLSKATIWLPFISVILLSGSLLIHEIAVYNLLQRNFYGILIILGITSALTLMIMTIWLFIADYKKLNGGTNAGTVVAE